MNKKKLLLIQLNEINFELVRKYQNNIEFQFFNEDFFKKPILFISDDLINPLKVSISLIFIIKTYHFK